MGSETRVRNCRLTLRFSEDELARATEMANQCDLGLSTYLREVGLGYEPKSTIDSQAVAQLAHLHGDLGRVGGLLKMWLSDNSKSGYGRSLNIPELVDRLLSLQQEIGEVVRKL
ncbi:hypothetical protein L9S41_17140 [Geoalkalibacter halelectricus]|uniref:Conjugal transfer protein TraJ n=1 Tax=Geoalkalibacter halelectricus TaxID=2847045 RepID=A0ABY5ZQ90_9BACT|nr:hypothetical protein [Geoalkalibacter halelectricus]UWZ79386.1 hypothetical protein L9S41_17140 [Geoalkalibacter halelectricus]